MNPEIYYVFEPWNKFRFSIQATWIDIEPMKAYLKYLL